MMIRRLFAINLKVLLSGVMKINSGAKAPSTGKTAFAAIVGLVAAISIFSMFYMMFDSMCEAYFSAGIGFMYFSMLAVTVFLLCVISSVLAGAAIVFGAKDNDLLLSMPIKPYAILIGRLLVLFTAECAMTLLAALAAFVPWAAGGHATGMGILLFIIGVALLPLMALSAALLLAWLLTLVSSRLRHRNIITLVLSAAFLIAYLYGYMNIQGYLGELVARGSELAEAFRVAMPPFYAFGAGIADGDIVDGLAFAAWAIVPFAAALLLLAANYHRILATERGSAKIVYREKRTAARGALPALIGKEMGKFWSKPTIVLNASIGSVFMLASPLILIRPAGILAQMDALATMSGIAPAAILAMAFAFLGVSNNVSASLVSLEGPNLWIAKSIPVPAQAILRAKLAAHMLLSSIPCLFASLCFGAALAGGPADWLMLLIVPQTAIALAGVLGLMLNLHFPKLDWTNEIQVVKQSVAAMFTLFGAWGFLFILWALYFFGYSAVIPAPAYLLSCSALFAAASVCAYAWLMRRGAQMFTEL
ncbi:MAG: hypothetical protein LBH39_00530 [Clostridiales Family XIII bacterium]|jgi:ABC-2 type transport system permease protein|nr:hypothetical protein [Clostridiales Family XIII bacterium]